MDKQDVHNVIQRQIYTTIGHSDLAFGNGVETDLGTFYRLSRALTAVVCDSAWFITRQVVGNDPNDIEQLEQGLSSMIKSTVGTPDITGEYRRSLIRMIIKGLQNQSYGSTTNQH